MPFFTTEDAETTEETNVSQCFARCTVQKVPSVVNLELPELSIRFFLCVLCVLCGDRIGAVSSMVKEFCVKGITASGRDCSRALPQWWSADRAPAPRWSRRARRAHAGAASS